MIDYDFESRLIDGIAVREAANARLTSRERRVLRENCIEGISLREIATAEGLTGERIGQIRAQALGKLREPEAGLIEAKVEPAQPQNGLPPGFDTAAFLRHMRGLIERRAAKRAEQRALERDRLHKMLAAEAVKKQRAAAQREAEARAQRERDENAALQRLRELAMAAVQAAYRAHQRGEFPTLIAALEEKAAAAVAESARYALALAEKRYAERGPYDSFNRKAEVLPLHPLVPQGYGVAPPLDVSACPAGDPIQAMCWRFAHGHHGRVMDMRGCMPPSPDGMAKLVHFKGPVAYQIDQSRQAIAQPGRYIVPSNTLGDLPEHLAPVLGWFPMDEVITGAI